MGKRRRRGTPAGSSPRAETSAGAPGLVGARISIAVLALAIVGVGLVVDTGADSAFDAPKRLLCLLFVGIAAAGIFAFARFRNPIPAGGSRSARWTLWLVAAALALAALSALFSPRRALALDALRALALYALLLPIGASRAFERGKTILLAAFLAVTTINAAVSFLQARGLYHPFPLRTTGGRESTGAFVGNVGYLALTLALAAVAALAVMLTARSRSVRIVGGLCLALFLVSLLFNRNLTSISSLFVGATVYLVVRFGRRAIPYAAAVVLVLVLGIAQSPMRVRVRQAWRAARGRNWNALTTYRFGAWKSAVEMAKDRPLLGYGPGTFGAEFVAHRLAAEIASRRRFINPLLTSAYTESHCDYLQPLGELGVPAGLAAVGAAGLMFWGLARRLRRADPERRREIELLLGFLATGAVGALTWFPMQRPITALPLLLAAGRAWKISAGDAAGSAELATRPRALRWGAGIGVFVLLAGAVWPEFARHAAERALRQASGGLRFVLTHPSEVADPQDTLSRLAALASGAADSLPGDPRPWVVAGGAYLVKGEPDRALDLYRRALGQGERAEIDLNMARAWDGLGRPEPAHAAYLRAAWISPRLVSAMPRDIVGKLHEEVKALRKALRAGQLKAPPPLPE